MNRTDAGFAPVSHLSWQLPVVALMLLISSTAMCLQLAADQPRDSPTFDLRTLLEHTIIPSVRVTVQDPVYGSLKTYEAYELKAVLTAVIPNVEQYKGSAKLVFLCQDGYSPSMSLERALGQGAYLAFRDLSATDPERWTPFHQGKELITPAPFYLVWKTAPGEKNLPWPYQIERLQILPFTPSKRRSFLLSEGARRGEKLFSEHCLRCHSLNLAGGFVGPELNVPRSVTEYWPPSVLKRFILDSESFHSHSKMPSFRDTLSSQDVNDIVFYLRAMSARKVCGTRDKCNLLAAQQ